MTNEEIKELIRRRRGQMLVHSYIYYKRDENLITDFDFDKWAFELAELQNKYPELAKECPYADAFEDWDGSTGAFLPYELPNIVAIAERLLGNTPKALPKKKGRLF